MKKTSCPQCKKQTDQSPCENCGYEFEDLETDQFMGELSCLKCGKILSETTFNIYQGMCGTCWTERN